MILTYTTLFTPQNEPKFNNQVIQIQCHQQVDILQIDANRWF